MSLDTEAIVEDVDGLEEEVVGMMRFAGVDFSLEVE